MATNVNKQNGWWSDLVETIAWLSSIISSRVPTDMGVPRSSSTYHTEKLQQQKKTSLCVLNLLQKK